MSKRASTLFLVRPAMETLFARSKESLWPETILNDPVLVQEASLRHSLYVALSAIFERVPVTEELSAAVDRKLIATDEAARMYDLLAAFLDADKYHKRLVLYLPFELIPSADWQPESAELKASATRFMQSYVKRWRELLDDIDVRANFVDGNILEPELAPYGQPLVRKAAHLIPQLIYKKHLTITDAKTMRDRTDSEILRANITDALSAIETAAGTAAAREEEISLERLASLQAEVESELRKLDMREALDHSRNMPSARVAWERRNNEDLLVTRYARLIAWCLCGEKVAFAPVQGHLSSPQMALRVAAMRGVGLAVEQLADANRRAADVLVLAFLTAFENTWLKEASICDEVEGILSRWASLSVVSEAQVRAFGLELPKLDAEFSTSSPLADELRGFSGAVEAIAQNPEYSRLLYPVVIFFGSRLKGYAKRNADLDAAVFIRPGISKKEREKIHHILDELFPSDRIDGKIVEFWLQESRQGLVIRDFRHPDVFLGDGTWVHLLLGSVWLGEKRTLAELYEKLLPGFLYSGGKTLMSRNARETWLAELEREVLQYRLMHKGYRRFYPPRGGVGNQPRLDCESVFWDSGYRRLATKLYISRIFLPQLSVRKN